MTISDFERWAMLCVFPLSFSAWEVSHHWSVVQQGCLPSLLACYKSGREIAAGTSLPFLSALAHQDHSRGLKRQEHSTNLHLLLCLESTSDFSPLFCSCLRKVACPFSARFENVLATFEHFKQHWYYSIFYIILIAIFSMWHSIRSFCIIHVWNDSKVKYYSAMSFLSLICICNLWLQWTYTC